MALTQIWVDLGRDVMLTHFYAKFCGKIETHFYIRATNFKLKFHIFSKIVELSSKFLKFWYQIYEIGPIFIQILENLENLTQFCTSFCTE